MKKPVLIIIIIGILLTACSPSESSVQTAIAQTQANQATATSAPTFTPVPPTFTPEPTATSTPEPSPTPDLRVINVDPYELLLKKSDCNPEGRYYLPNELWMSPVKNAEVISGWTVEKGRTYLAETGRIDGWAAAYEKGNPNVLLPQEVGDNVVLFSSIEGARLVITKYQDRYVEDFFYEELLNKPQVGDVSRSFVLKESYGSGGTGIFYVITFAFRNITHSVSVYGYEEEVKFEDAIYLAEKLLKQLEGMPLSDAVTIKP